jgi:CheY-like chemotaxis protein
MPVDSPASRILIVDDQASNVRLLEFTMRRGGYNDVDSTSDPTQVEALHREKQYELILLDLQMPVMSGFEVMKMLRAGADAPRVAILVISADPALMVTALEGGADGFMSKPYRLPDVLERVGAMLAKCRAS